ncbi:RNA methyltransferase [Emydomyces testavorans]|uniref:rRNA methyltransferase 1, mitochondrial n=1 Tax=Emydomyces testavorans TaxID=2070801 RepID=A0AAF0DG98_9EURO|nr:RNA methyltransferase [Emydomyces testavorans]
MAFAISKGIRKDYSSIWHRRGAWNKKKKKGSETDNGEPQRGAAQNQERLYKPREWRRPPRKPKKEKPVDINEPVSLVSKVSIVAPRSVPYTTAASEFVYGYSAVRAAIRCGRRKIYTLYIFDADPESKRWAEPEINSLQKFAAAAGARVKLVSGTWAKMLDKMTDGRPHNGFLVEVSPLPKLPALSYDAVPSLPASHFNVHVAPQSREEADVNGSNGHIPLVSQQQGSLTQDGRQQTPRYPFTLLLDGILDPGNLGAIIRSAYFFGVDAIAFSSRNSAPLSPVTIKASAGAAENLPLISIHDPISFVDITRKNGWRFFAAEPPASTASGYFFAGMDGSSLLSLQNLSTELRKSPCVLMLGGEGYGLTKALKRQADALVAIPGARTADLSGDPAGVDSLNVSVASGLLCEAFLRELPVVGTTTAAAAVPGTAQGEQSQDPATPEEQPAVSNAAEEDRVF